MYRETLGSLTMRWERLKTWRQVIRMKPIEREKSISGMPSGHPQIDLLLTFTYIKGKP